MSVRPRRRRREPTDWPRAVLVSVVAAGLAALLALGSLAGTGNGRMRAVAQSASLLPSASLSARRATVWNCPGPLNLSAGSASVAVANPSRHAARVLVQVAETALVPGLLVDHRLGLETSQEVVPAGSELEIPLAAGALPPRLRQAVRSARSKGSAPKRAKGPRRPLVVYGAVSLTVSGASVGVSETALQAKSVETSACALGAATRGYTASGTTYDSSTVELSLFDPSAAPAVVNLSLGTAAGLSMPQALQGLVVPPQSLEVIDLARYVPQAVRLAVAADATVGRVVIGSLTEVSARFATTLLGRKHAYDETGSELAVGIGRPLRSFVAPLGPNTSRFSESVGLFNPGTKPAQVLVQADEQGRRSRLSVLVPAGEVTSVPLPDLLPGPGSPRKASKLSPQAAPSVAPILPAGTGGVVRVTSENGVGVVADHETVVSTSPGRLLLMASALSARPSRCWLLAGGASSHALSFEVTITDLSSKPEQAALDLLRTGSQGPPSLIESLSLEPGTARGLDLARVPSTSNLGPFALLVKADGPVVVTGALARSVKAALPSVESAIPAGR